MNEDLAPLLRELVAEMREMNAGMRGLRGDLQGIARRRSKLRERDRKRLALLLPAIDRAYGDRAFSTRELVGFAQTNLPNAGALCAILLCEHRQRR